jgi:hypothetical protein
VLQSTKDDTNIEVPGLVNGIYIAKIKIGEKNYYLKCIKE